MSTVVNLLCKNDVTISVDKRLKTGYGRAGRNDMTNGNELKSRKKCERCGKVFRPQRAWQKFCTTQCGDADRHRKQRERLKNGE